MSNKLKIVISIIIISLIGSVIASRLGCKFEQQKRIQIREELLKLDSKLRREGVNICLIQPIHGNKRKLIVMLNFWENDPEQIKKRLDSIKDTIYKYVIKVNGTTSAPVIKYLDDEGYNLDDTLQAQLEMNIDETEAEYYDVVRKFTLGLDKKLKEEFSKVINGANFDIRILADVKYDVTTDSYSPKKLFFYARFNNASTDQLQKVRIIYKKLSGFKVSRGDKIYFYNLKPEEFKLVRELTFIMTTKESEDVTVQAIYFDPVSTMKQIINNVNKERNTMPTTIFESPYPKHLISPTPSIVPYTPIPSPSPTPTFLPQNSPIPSPTLKDENYDL